MKKFSIKLDADTLKLLYSALDNAINQDGVSQDRLETLYGAQSEVRDCLDAYELMEQATILLDDKEFIAYEDPIAGDEGSIMLWDKNRCIFYRETDFMDVDDPDEIRQCLFEMSANFT